jgi:hypothetical protein
MSLVVGFKQKLPFRRIAGRDYCLWRYDVTPDPAADIAQLALGFSGLLDIRDPTDFPDVAVLTGTRLEKSLTGGNQFIFVTPLPEHLDTLSVHLIAPCAEDSFTPIIVATIDGNGQRHSPVFRASPEAPDNTVQIVLGPSAASPVLAAQGSPAVVKTGTLPYASELFGVYQPLLGWRSALAQSRLSDAAANRFAAATRLIVSDAPLTVEKPIGSLQSRGALNRTGSNIGQATRDPPFRSPRQFRCRHRMAHAAHSVAWFGAVDDYAKRNVRAAEECGCGLGQPNGPGAKQVGRRPRLAPGGTLGRDNIDSIGYPLVLDAGRCLK